MMQQGQPFGRERLLVGIRIRMRVPVLRSARYFPHNVVWGSLLRAPESHHFAHGCLLNFQQKGYFAESTTQYFTS